MRTVFCLLLMLAAAVLTAALGFGLNSVYAVKGEAPVAATPAKLTQP